MYNNTGVLPVTGMVSVGIAGLSGHQMVALGLFVTVVGVMVFKMFRFKVKDK
jgi:hypothetical protein